VDARNSQRQQATEPVSPIRKALLSNDTDRAVEERQFEIWRALSTEQIAQVIRGASQTARRLALAGLRDRYPAASERELTVRLAVLTLGRDLAVRVYPELEQLKP
jgi:hypothetical protein